MVLVNRDLIKVIRFLDVITPLDTVNFLGIEISWMYSTPSKNFSTSKTVKFLCMINKG